MDAPEGPLPAGVWSSLVSEPGTGVFIISHDGRVLYVNEQGAVMLMGQGRTAGELTGRHLSEFMPSAWVDERRAVMQRIQETGEPALLRTIWHGLQQFSWIHGIEPDVDEKPPPGLRYNHFLVILRRGLAPTVDHTGKTYTFLESGVANLGPLESLTARELEVLALIGQGLSAKEISKVLHRSVRTVEGHRMSLGRKRAMDDRVKLAEIARRAGLTLRDVERKRV